MTHHRFPSWRVLLFSCRVRKHRTAQRTGAVAVWLAAALAPFGPLMGHPGQHCLHQASGTKAGLVRHDSTGRLPGRVTIGTHHCCGKLAKSEQPWTTQGIHDGCRCSPVFCACAPSEPAHRPLPAMVSGGVRLVCIADMVDVPLVDTEFFTPRSTGSRIAPRSSLHALDRCVLLARLTL